MVGCIFKARGGVAVAGRNRAARNSSRAAAPPAGWVKTDGSGYGHQRSLLIKDCHEATHRFFKWPMRQGAGLPVSWVIFFYLADMNDGANASGKTGVVAIVVQPATPVGLPRPTDFPVCLAKRSARPVNWQAPPVST